MWKNTLSFKQCWNKQLGKWKPPVISPPEKSLSTFGEHSSWLNSLLKAKNNSVVCCHIVVKEASLHMNKEENSMVYYPKLTRRSNQSILKISPGCSLEGLMVKLKLQYFGHLMRRADSFEKTQMLGGTGGRRRRGRQRMRWLNGITDSMDVSLSELRESWNSRRVKDRIKVPDA